MPTDAVASPEVAASTGLAHTLKTRHVTMISFGGIIGAGLFVGASGAIHKGGPAVAVAYAVVGLLVFLIMRMLGEMAVARPGQGSFAEYASLALGNWAGFVLRWLYWYFWVFTVGAETVAGANLLHQIGLPGPVWAVGLSLVAIMTASNLLSVRAYGELEFWFSLLKVSAIGAFVVVGVGYIIGWGGGAHHVIQTVTGHGGFMPNGLAGLLAAAPVVIFSMVGCEVATIAAAESADPAANVARAGRTVALRILTFYVAAILVIVAIVPWNTLVVGLSPFKAVMDVIGIPGSALVMQVIVITAVLSCLNSGIYITSRMLHELALSGGAPAGMARTAKNKAPRIGILIGCGAGFAAALAQLYMQEDVFTLLASTSGDIMLVVYLIIAFAQIAQRRKLEAEGVELKLKMWLFPWASYAVIAAIIGALLLLAFLPGQRMTLLLSGVTVVAVAVALLVRNLMGGARPGASAA